MSQLRIAPALFVRHSTFPLSFFACSSLLALEVCLSLSLECSSSSARTNHHSHISFRVFTPKKSLGWGTSPSGGVSIFLRYSLASLKVCSISDRADMWIRHGEDSTPEAWDCSVTSCLRPATRKPSPLTGPSKNLTDYETLQRTFLTTAARCLDNAVRFTPVVFCGHAGRWDDSARTMVTWSSTSLCTPNDINLDLRTNVGLHDSFNTVPETSRKEVTTCGSEVVPE